MPSIDRRSFVTGLAAAAVSAPSLAQPQIFQGKEVRIIVPSPPGGPADLYARLLNRHFAQTFGGTFIAENRPGAAGALAGSALARANPDGRTLLIGSNATLILTPLTLRKTNLDPIRDFSPVGMVMSYAMYLVGRVGLPFQDIPGLVAYARANPKKLSFASFGVGSIAQLTHAVFCRKAGIEVEHIPYQGTAAVIQALMRGEVDYAFDSVGNSQSFVDTGMIKPLAVSTAERARQVPDIPTFSESGYPLDQRIWLGLVAPRETPRELIEQLNGALDKFVQLPETMSMLEKSAYDPLTETPTAMTARIVKEKEFWSEVIRDEKIATD